MKEALALQPSDWALRPSKSEGCPEVPHPSFLPAESWEIIINTVCLQSGWGQFLRKLGYLIHVPTLLSHWLRVALGGVHYLVLLACLIGGQSRLHLPGDHFTKKGEFPWPVDVGPVRAAEARAGLGARRGQPAPGTPTHRTSDLLTNGGFPLSSEGRLSTASVMRR